MSQFIKMSGSTLSASLNGSGYALGVSEFQMLDGLTAGTVQASKLTVVDSNKDITGYRSVTGSGDIFFANAVLSGDLRLDDDLTVGDDATIGGDLDVTGDLTPGTITMAEFTVAANGNTDIDGTLNVEGVPTFQAGAVFSDGVTTANAIAGATTVSGSGLFSAAGGLDAGSGRMTVSAAGALSAASLVSTSTISGSTGVSGQTLSCDGLASLDGGINVSDTLTVSAAGALAGATTISGSSTISGHALDIETTADLGGKLTVVGVSDLDGGINVNASKFTVSAAGAVVADSTVSGAAGSFDALTATTLALQTGGITAAGAIAGASTVSGSGLFSAAGGLDAGSGRFTVSAAGAVVAASLSLSEGNALNVGVIEADTIQGDDAAVGLNINFDGNTGLDKITVADNQADALSIVDAGGLDYVVLQSTNASPGIMLSQNTQIADGKLLAFSDSAAENIQVTDSSLQLTSDTAILHNAPSNVFFSSTSEKPTVTIKNTNADANGGSLVFHKSGSSPADNDVLGSMTFVAGNDASGHADITYGSISMKSADVSDGSEDGSMHFNAMIAGADSSYMDFNGSEASVLTIAAGISVKADVFHARSDRELKKNIQDMDNNTALDAVMSLQPRTYQKKLTGQSEIGFIAQDVAKIVPEVCALDADGVGRAIDYSRMSTLLAGALKAQQEQIAQLKEIVAKLQK